MATAAPRGATPRAPDEDLWRSQNKVTDTGLEKVRVFSKRELVVTSASLLETSALLVVTRKQESHKRGWVFSRM